ncbi:MAG: PAS and ANTAR domain-containing protein [Mycobacterium sp.]|nr:PAS and ANTAR domain-containing protein [Mycobacterium sp.]
MTATKDDPVSGGLEDATAQQPLTDSHRVGWVRYFFDDDRWEWSPEVARIHGYEPGTVTPTTELVLSHKHPQDHARLVESLEHIRTARQAFSSRHRIIDTKGQVHHVLVAGHQMRDDSGRVIGTDAFYLDLTANENAHEERVGAAIEKITASRAGIEQAKGMLRAIYGIDDDAAFELLRWRSQTANVKLRELAEQIVNDFSGASTKESSLPDRSVYDHLLMTVHSRIRR